MPKAKMVKVSEKTLLLLKSYKKEFGFKSLEESVKNAIQWSRLWVYVDSKTRRSMQKRISDLEFRTEKLDRQTLQDVGRLGKILKRVRALEKSIKN